MASASPRRVRARSPSPGPPGEEGAGPLEAGPRKERRGVHPGMDGGGLGEMGVGDVVAAQAFGQQPEVVVNRGSDGAGAGGGYERSQGLQPFVEQLRPSELSRAGTCLGPGLGANPATPGSPCLDATGSSASFPRTTPGSVWSSRRKRADERGRVSEP